MSGLKGAGLKRLLVIAVVLAELLAMIAVSRQTIDAYAHLHMAKDDLGWSVYQLDKEFQRLLTATIDGSPPEGVKLRAQIFTSRLNIIQKDAIFADMRAGKLGVELDAFFEQMQPLVDEARGLGTAEGIRSFSARLAKCGSIITKITQDIDTEIRRSAVQDRSTFDQLLGKTLALFLLLAATLLVLGFMQLWHVRKLEATLQRLTEKDRGILKIWDQVADPLLLVAVPFQGIQSIHYSNKACETALGGRPVLAEILSMVDCLHNPAGKDKRKAGPVAVNGKFIENECFDLGSLQIENFGQCVLVRLRDVTEEMANLSKSRSLQSRLAEAEEWKFLGRAAASVVHELHQPLAAAANFLYVASDTISAHENLDNLPYLIDRSKQMLFRIEQISSQMRSLVPVSKSDWEVASLRDLAAEARNIIAASEAFSARIKISRASPVHFRGSPVQLTQVFINLMRNALEASDRKAKGLTVTADFRAEDGHAVCDIADEAGGIPQDVLEAAFGSGLTPKSHGMGLGLAISRHLVEVNGGTLSCARNDRGGTTFTLRLPLAPVAQSPQENALEQG